MSSYSREVIKVCIRMRPLLQPYEDEEILGIDLRTNSVYTLTNTFASKLLDISSNSSGSLRDKESRLRYAETLGPQSFSFDYIYGPDSTSQQIYYEISRPIIYRILNGYNGTIFMYGQTTSGKTYTMLGTPEFPGILPCSIREIFQTIVKDAENEYNVWVSYIEIYNEQINDLLAPGKVNLKVKEDHKQGIIIQDVKQQQVWTFDQVILLMNYGEEHRTYRETSIHEHSSRSHTLFQVYIESYSRGSKGKGRIRYGCLNLVDLAGSERLNEFDSKQSSQLGEAGYINKSLFVLAHVINKLAEGKTQHIPYRDSKLTRILSMALGGNSLTAIICTISPAAMNYQQTLSTLRFASRAKTVHNTPHINEVLGEVTASNELKSQLTKLQQEILELNTFKISYENKIKFLEKQLESTKADLVDKDQQLNLLIDGTNKEREVVERLQFLLEKQELEFDKERVRLGTQSQKIVEKYQEERKARTELEKELETLKEILAKTIKSEQLTLSQLNQLIVKSGGNPVEIPNPDFSYHPNIDMGYIESLIFHIETDVSIPPGNLMEWKNLTSKIDSEYRNNLKKIQEQYFLKVQTLSERLIEDQRKIENILNSYRGLPKNNSFTFQ
jgi:Kinesin motor domain